MKVDTPVSLCFWEALGDWEAKVQVLMDDPRTDAALAMESIARMRDMIDDFTRMLNDSTYMQTLRRVEEWAASKGVDLADVYAAR
jgi:hypothetical protein